MSSHHCNWTMQTQSDSGCVDFENNEELCSLSLVDTAILDQCANGLPWFEMITCNFSSSNFWDTEEFNILIIRVIWNQENWEHSCNLSYVKYVWISENLIPPPLLFSNVFPGYRGLQYLLYFLCFWSLHFSSPARNPNSPTLACKWIPTLTLHILTHNSRLY